MNKKEEGLSNVITHQNIIQKRYMQTEKIQHVNPKAMNNIRYHWDMQVG